MRSSDTTLTWLWGNTAHKLAQSLQHLAAQKIYCVAEQSAHAPAPNLFILSSEAVVQSEKTTATGLDAIFALDPTALLNDFKQHSLNMIEWIQRAIVAMNKGHAAHKGTIIVLAMHKPEFEATHGIMSKARQAGLNHLVQSLAREWNKKGIHLAYVSLSSNTPMQDIAALCWQIHQQPMSSWSTQPLVLDVTTHPAV